MNHHPMYSGNSMHRTSRRGTAQAMSMTAIRRPNGFGHRHQLSIQEQPSPHPPINRAGFSQIMMSPRSDAGCDDNMNGATVCTNTMGNGIAGEPVPGNRMSVTISNGINGQHTPCSYSNSSNSNLFTPTPGAGAGTPVAGTALTQTTSLSVSVPTNNKSRPELISPRSECDGEHKDVSDDDEDESIQHSGWMYKAGKWDGNWTHRYCVLTAEPVQLQCFVAPEKKQTHCIDFKEVRTCIELKKNSDKYRSLEIPTSYAFQLVTMQRIYTFACESRHDLNVWLKKIRRDVEVSPHDAQIGKMGKRSSIVKIQSAVGKFTTGLGRLIGVTPEHVTTTEVLKTENVQIQRGPMLLNRANQLKALEEWNSLTIHDLDIPGITRNRRRSVPAIPSNWRQSDGTIMVIPKKRRRDGSRRRSAPDLRNLKQIAEMNDMSHSLGMLQMVDDGVELVGPKMEKLVKSGARQSFDDKVDDEDVDINENIASVLQNIENDARDQDEESLSYLD